MSGLDEDASRDAPEVLITSGLEEGAAAERSGAIMVGQAAEERAAAIAAAYASGIFVRLSFLFVGGPVGAALATQARVGCPLEGARAQSPSSRSFVGEVLPSHGRRAAWPRGRSRRGFPILN